MRKVYECFVTLLVCVVFGCGGGTRGSGGQLFDGFVSDVNGKALIQVNVTITATGDSATTDDNGRFSITTDDLSGGVEFLLEASTFSGTVISQEIPADASTISVKFVVGNGAKPEIETEIEVKERRPTPSPTPRRTPTPGTTPSPNPTIDDHGGNSGSDGSDDSENDDSGSHSGSSGSGSSGNGGSPTGTASPSPTPESHEGENVDAEGVLTFVSANLVTVQGKDFVPAQSTEYRNKKGERVSLDAFSVGETVKARGKITNGVVVLQKLEIR